MMREQRPQHRQNRFVAGITVHRGSNTNTSGRSRTSISRTHSRMSGTNRHRAYSSALTSRTCSMAVSHAQVFQTQLTSRPSASISCPAASQRSSSGQREFCSRNRPGSANAG
jgi:hypothetical protein